MRGTWRLSADKLTELAFKVGDWPTIWHNVATLRAWTADTQRAVDAWRKYAAQRIPLDDAIEAEALAQGRWDPDALDQVDVLSIIYEVKDIEALQARLTANPRALQMPVDLARMESADEPPPKGACSFDRASPASGKDIMRSRIPHRRPGLSVRQADGSGRTTGADRLSHDSRQSQDRGRRNRRRRLAISEEEVTSQVPAAQQVLSWNSHCRRYAARTSNWN